MMIQLYVIYSIGKGQGCQIETWKILFAFKQYFRQNNNWSLDIGALLRPVLRIRVLIALQNWIRIPLISRLDPYLIPILNWAGAVSGSLSEAELELDSDPIPHNAETGSRFRSINILNTASDVQNTQIQKFSVWI